MMRTLTYMTAGAVMIYWLLTLGMTAAKGSEYNQAVIGHVITQKITGQSIDTSKLLEQELARAAHIFAIDAVNILQKYMPSILDGISAQLRAEADKSYKCGLIKDTSIKCND